MDDECTIVEAAGAAQRRPDNEQAGDISAVLDQPAGRRFHCIEQGILLQQIIV